ncbi:MAG: M48 family metallopeptidase [Myxococcota bacterium]
MTTASDAAQTGSRQGGFRQSGRRTAIEVGVVVVGLALAAFGGRSCLGWTAERAVDFIPAEADAQVGAAGAEQFRAQYAAAGSPPADAEARVQRIFLELVDALSADERARLGAPRVTVVVDETPNAFALPGGEVFVLTGLLERADDAMLRGVLAHELGHAVARHGMRGLARRAAFGVTLAALVGEVDGLVLTLTAGASELDRLAHSRDMESEADAFGVALLDRTGHDPEGLARFLESLGPQPIPAWISTHPEPAARAAEIRADHDL